MQVILMVLQSLLLLALPVFSQYNNIKPDVTYGDHNDRFDVSDLVAYQNKYFRADGSMDYRRRHGPKRAHLRSAFNPEEKQWFISSDRKNKKYVQKIKKEAEKQLNELANAILLRMKSTRRTGEDFAFQDYGGNENNLDARLEKFKRDLVKELHDKIREPTFEYRRTGTVPNTFDYAFPIEMNVEGYLVPPETQ